MGKFIDLVGQKFGKLTVIARAENKGKATLWLCECDCGNKITVRPYDLKTGKTKSCGCYSSIFISLSKIKHGKSGTRIYNIYGKIKQRCLNVKDPKYYCYGGRGISICDEWKNDFKAFYDWAISNGYADNLTIDRIDVNGNYEPFNCRWVTLKEQANNKQNTLFVNYQGKTHTLLEWSKILNIKYDTLHGRLKDYGWNTERAFNTIVS